MKRLSTALAQPRDEWPPSLLRRIWELLVELDAGRKRSPLHEARWVNLLGYALRPGYGLALDDWRVAETWKLLHGKLHHSAAVCQTEWWILWRRIGGGLTGGQQQAVADPLLTPVRALHRRMQGKGKGTEFSFTTQESVEVWRLLGSLELLPAALKLELGQICLDLLGKKKMEAVWPALAWTLGRIGARAPAYGPLNTVLAADVAADWLATALGVLLDDAQGHSAAMQLARRTGDRYRDIPEKLRGEVVGWMTKGKARPHLIELVREGGTLDADEQGRIFGEALPKGLRIG
jgi:hypothetical protein